AVNVLAAETDDEAQEMHLAVRRRRVHRFLVPGEPYSDARADAILATPRGRQILSMMTYSAVGTPSAVMEYLDWFTDHSHADELIVTLPATSGAARIRSAELLAEVAGLPGAGAAAAGTPAAGTHGDA